jgi:hypothetical protein
MLIEKIKDSMDNFITERVDNAFPSIYTKEDVSILLKKYTAVITTIVEDGKDNSITELTESQKINFCEELFSEMLNANREEIDRNLTNSSQSILSDVDFNIERGCEIVIDSIEIDTDVILDDVVNAKVGNFTSVYVNLFNFCLETVNGLK